MHLIDLFNICSFCIRRRFRGASTWRYIKGAKELVLNQERPILLGSRIWTVLARDALCTKFYERLRSSLEELIFSLWRWRVVHTWNHFLKYVCASVSVPKVVSRCAVLLPLGSRYILKKSQKERLSTIKGVQGILPRWMRSCGRLRKLANIAGITKKQVSYNT